MKIDVEGSEVAVLKGAEETINKNKPIFFIETNAFNLPLVKKYLAGYRFYKLYIKGLDYKKNRIKRVFDVIKTLILPMIELIEMLEDDDKSMEYIDNVIAIPDGYNLKEFYELNI